MGRYFNRNLVVTLIRSVKSVEALEHQLVEFLTNLLQTINWFGVVVIMALESANIPIPSEVTMPLSGWMLVQAKGKTAWDAFLLGEGVFI